MNTKQLRRVSNAVENKLRKLEGFEGIAVVVPHIYNGAQQWQVISTDKRLQAAIESSLGPIGYAYENATSVPTLEEFTRMPKNAEERATAVRKLLHAAWKTHTKGTSYEGNKQMYNVVAKEPLMKFGWWDDVTDAAPFTNTAVNTPTISRKLFEYLAPTMYRTIYAP
jgi:hypothetical protein